MKKNIGSADRIIRIILAAIAAILYLTNIITGTFGIVLMVIAAVFVITSFIGVCPLYLPLGISSCKKQS